MAPTCSPLFSLKNDCFSNRKVFACFVEFFIFSVLILVGCDIDNEVQTAKSHSRSNIVEFEYNRESISSIEGEVLNASDSLGRIHEVEKVGDYLLVADMFGSPFGHVLHAGRGEYVVPLGKQRGQGPGEFQSIVSFDVTSEERAQVWLYDLTALRLTYLDLPSYVAGTYSLADSLVTLEIGFTLTAPHWLGDSLLVSPGFLTEPGRLAYLNPQGKLLRVRGKSPPNPDDDPLAVLQHGYQAYMAAHPTDSLLVLATRYADRLEIYWPGGERKMLIRGPDNFDPKYEVGTMQGEPVWASTDETRSGYLDVVATQSHIYALYSGRFHDERYSGLGSFVHILGWEGKLQAVYNLEAHVSGIEVDEESGRLYATRAVPKPAIVTYEIPLLPGEQKE